LTTAVTAGPDPDDLVDRGAPHLAVTDRAGLRRLGDDVDHVTGVRVVAQDLDAHLRHEGDGVLGTTVDLGVAALAPEALHLADRHPLHPEGLEGGLDVVQLERLDDRGHDPHAWTLPAPVATEVAREVPAPAKPPDRMPPSS
jgi:hypothetical protein